MIGKYFAKSEMDEEILLQHDIISFLKKIWSSIKIFFLFGKTVVDYVLYLHVNGYPFLASLYYVLLSIFKFSIN